LRTDGTLACWGSNDFGESAAPSGKFIDIAAGDHHACAVGPDGSVSCWGDNRRLQCRPPAGKFRQVSAGRDHSCAIAADSTITCWGGWRAPDAPSEPGAKPANTAPAYWKAYARAGSFAQVSSYGQGNCAIALDGSWHAWDIYFSNEGTTDGEPGDHCQVSGGTGHGCILKCNGEILCWGGWEYKQLLPPRFAFWPPGKPCDGERKRIGICD
jgi:alpha-tubulin suppressor-like RCC1 family protein